MFEIKNLFVNYGHVKAVKGISFRLEKGEIVSILGSNGAGKTSTLMGIMSIVKSDREIYFKGENISKAKTTKLVKRGLILCPENRRIFPGLTVEENLKMGSFIRGDEKNNLEKVYNLFPILKNRKKQIAGSLSGGEQQMLAVGRALMGDPEVLMLDEPSLGLAPIIIDEIFNVLIELKKQGISILLVEQNAIKALKISNRAYILETGKIVHSGIAKELLYDEKIKKAYLGR
ncbi:MULTISPECIES: ABC transporter ATP-binding protein [unclassified Marinitoga]|uniref:ABC transporter ATP-binding protein n=1 Tax=unclassified Marinitoga TaxID=2640159 RepID=UPI0006418622|nr:MULTISPECIES: ABC transporter ATP-binding protein [unclassified Marinitoga]KLO22469.1 amino acid ABC transporter ATP-binding protein [Marinitoga sp. 1155]NUV00261.1 amino acid ABC transporter ATPase [Marinitoga sp. 1154]